MTGDDDVQDDDELLEDDGEEGATLRCWCGAEGTFEELFDDDHLDKRCGGSGVLYCHCGGDLCVCHYHGETDCSGCPDCEEHEDDWDEGLIEPWRD